MKRLKAAVICPRAASLLVPKQVQLRTRMKPTLAWEATKWARPATARTLEVLTTVKTWAIWDLVLLVAVAGSE